MHLYRATAYQIQPLDTPERDMQPEACVFFEARSPECAPATLLRLLSLAWGCTPADVEFYNLMSEDEVLAEGAEEAPGDASLWLSGWYNGPLYRRADQALMFVRPTTARRLHNAQAATIPFRTLQRLAAEKHEERLRAQERQRTGILGGLTRMLSGAQPPAART